MNILYIGSSLDTENGGVDRVTSVVSAYLESKGHICHYAFQPHYNNCVPHNRTLILSYGSDRKLWEGEFKAYLDDNKIDVIINQAQWSKPLVEFLADLNKDKICKVITCFHVSPDFYVHMQTLLGRLADIPSLIIRKYRRVILPIRKAYFSSNKFVLLSNSFVDDFTIRYDIKEHADKIIVIPNPLSFDEVYDGTTPKKKQALIVSRLEDGQKNIKSALRIWKEVELSHPDWKLVIAGSGPHEAMLKNYANQLQLSNVDFIGKVKDPRQLYKESSIFMMTSRYEGFGITLTEALQYGCIPIVFDSFSALHDILIDGYNGFIIPSNHEKKYINTFKMLVEDEDKMRGIRGNCVNSSSKFSLQTIGEKWIDLISK